MGTEIYPFYNQDRVQFLKCRQTTQPQFDGPCPGGAITGNGFPFLLFLIPMVPTTLGPPQAEKAPLSG